MHLIYDYDIVHALFACFDRFVFFERKEPSKATRHTKKNYWIWSYPLGECVPVCALSIRQPMTDGGFLNRHVLANQCETTSYSLVIPVTLANQSLEVTRRYFRYFGGPCAWQNPRFDEPSQGSPHCTAAACLNCTNITISQIIHLCRKRRVLMLLPTYTRLVPPAMVSGTSRGQRKTLFWNYKNPAQVVWRMSKAL